MRIPSLALAFTLAGAVTAMAAAPPAKAPATRPAAPQTLTMPRPPGPPPIPAAEIEKLFPNGAIQADVMDVLTDPRYDALVAKMRATIQKDPAWWELQRKKADPRGVVPWDAKMGITKPEYDEMMTLASKIHLARVASTTLTFKRGAAGEVTLDGGAAASELTGLRFSRDRQTVGGTYGAMQGRQDVHQSDAQAPSGIWNGVQWTGMSKDAKAGSAQLAMLAMGRMQPSKRALIFLSVRTMSSAGGRPSERTRIVSYAIAAP